MHERDPQSQVSDAHSPCVASAPIFALVDGNSFYCSCERVFNPSLINQPVIVLSNNDGCVISRTDEAKAVGIKMGDPLHLISDIIKRHRVRVYSSNYALYGDMSARMMTTLAQFTPELEVYSIDEAFLSLGGFAGRDMTEYAREIRRVVRRDTGIPTAIGIGPTKVLAKVANRAAKKNKISGGVLNLCDRAAQDSVLAEFAAADVWGIGARSAAKLARMGVTTAMQLRDADADAVQKLLTIVGRRIVLELRGQSCLALEMVQEDRKQIVSSKSFGRPVYKLTDLKEAVANYATRACEKLRRQKSSCHVLSVFVQTNRFKDGPQYYNSGTITFGAGTASTVRMIAAASGVLETIFRDGIEYKKAGVILSDVRLASSVEFSLFDDQHKHAQDIKTMSVMDAINARMGRDTLKVGACGNVRAGTSANAGANGVANVKVGGARMAQARAAGQSAPAPAWTMKAAMRTPCYTTRWQDLLKVG